PPGGGTLDRWSSTMSVADESVGAAQVRDADDGPEVVLVRRAGDRIRPLAGLTAADVPVDGPVPDDTARDLARCTVRLPAWVVRGRDEIRELEQDAVASWARSRWLRGCQALVLGEDLTRRLGDRVLRYDDTLGLVVTTEPGGGAGMGP
ncbi:CRISPR-associated helicase/endonuclease Cas3, partial [Corynebacterium bovis]